MQRTTSIRQIYACGSRLGLQSQLLHRRISQPKTCSPAKQHSSGSHLAKIWRNLHHRELMTHACGWVATPTCNKQRRTIIYCREVVVLSFQCPYNNLDCDKDLVTNLLAVVHSTPAKNLSIHFVKCCGYIIGHSEGRVAQIQAGAAFRRECY